MADAPSGKYSIYRLHIDDPVYFDEGIQVSIQTIGGCDKNQALSLLERGIPLIPVTLDAGIATPLVKFLECDSLSDLRNESLPHGWCNFWRQDDWRATAYFYFDSPSGISAPLDLTLNAWLPIPNAIIVVVFLNPVRGRYTLVKSYSFLRTEFPCHEADVISKMVFNF